MEIQRRQFITGLISLVAAPAIVRVSSIMPVKQMIILPSPDYYGEMLPPNMLQKDVFRIYWKMRHHSLNYSTSPEKFKEIIKHYNKGIA